MHILNHHHIVLGIFKSRILLHIVCIICELSVLLFLLVVAVVVSSGKVVTRGFRAQNFI